MRKIYLVKSLSRSYQCFFEKNERAFTDKKEAENFAIEFNKSHQNKPSFITDDFIKAIDECEANLPEWEPLPDDMSEEERNKWYQKQADISTRCIMDMMYQRGFLLTEQMHKQYQEWYNNMYLTWYDCIIEEIELYE